VTEPDPNLLVRVSAYDPFLSTGSPGAIPREVSEANHALDAYLEGSPLDLPTLSAIITAGTRALARSDADATVLALKDTRELLAAEREALRTELSEAKSVMMTEVAAHLSTVSSQAERLTGTMNDEVARLTAGLPENTRTVVQTMLTQLLGQFGEAVVANANAAFDPHTETSPFNRLVSTINASVAQHTRAVDTRIGDLETKLAVNDARAEERERSSRKGADFETLVEEVIGDYASGAGLHAVSTGLNNGLLRGNKKGDFVISEADGTPLVVVEAKNNSRHNSVPSIHAYLDEAEPNRGVTTSVWVIKGRDQHKGGLPLVMLTPSRWIVALEDETPGLVNAVLALAVATARRTRSAGTTDADVPAARAFVSEALSAVDDIAEIDKSVESVLRATEGITKKTTALRSKLLKSLKSATDALDGSACTPSLSDAQP